MTMPSIYSVILWIVLNISCCRPQCVTETLNSATFSITVIDHTEMESIDCIRMPYEMTFPREKVLVPYKKILFEGDPSNIVSTKVFSEMESDTKDIFEIEEHPRGEFEFGFMLEWGCNQTYIFPQRVHISVTAPSLNPYLSVSTLVEGQAGRLRCSAPRSCSRREHILLKWTKSDGQSTEIYGDENGYDRQFNRSRHRHRQYIPIYPTADYHNTNITCVAKYKYDAVETTVTLNVKFLPKILNDSHCEVKGELLVCVCISWGNPLPPIIWPLKPLTDYSISSSSTNQTVISTITLSAVEHQNTTMKCISRNELGQTEADILIQNSTEETQLTYPSEEKKGIGRALPWITVVCFSLNLVLITVLIIGIYQRRKMKQKKLSEETNTYASLRKTEVEDEYSIIPSQPN
ncbi:uncharacterized protein LOC108229964 [Kryptolebias marmoratus]|uniref:uncharacterized protein LOC108229964 n=1 Tax=Kryptolebias marmoratus TaxID=37003 RepID=UPI000D52F272|nr:uncharacterized protein LOC108229964 [Kryptolebias marmoratus]